MKRFRLLFVFSLLLVLNVAVGGVIVRLTQPSGDAPVVPTLAALPTLPPSERANVDEPVQVAAAPTQAIPTAAPIHPNPTLQPTLRHEPTTDASSAPTTVERSIVVPTYVANVQSQTLPPVPSAAAPQADPFTPQLPSEPIDNQLVIQFSADSTDAERMAYLQSLGAEIETQIEALDTIVVRVPDGVTQDTLPPAPILDTVEPDYPVFAMLDVPTSDPGYGDQWGLQVIRAPQAWLQLPDDTPTITVAVIDSGVCANHSDLQGRILSGYDFVGNDTIPDDEFGHGCGVAGVLAASIDNNTGIAGVAPNVQVLPVRVLNGNGGGSFSDVAAGIIYAADNGADIINLSLGGSIAPMALQDAVNYALNKGITIVAASGNSGAQGVIYPARYDGVIAVGSIDSSLEMSSFTTYGPELDLLAPGRDIMITTPEGGYELGSGTSFATPHAAGAAALELAMGRTLQTGGILVIGDAVEPMTLPDDEPIELSPDGIPEGFRLIEGDILIPADSPVGEAGAQATFSIDLWIGGVVPYMFSSGVSPSQQAIALDAMDDWEAASGLDFVARTTEREYIYLFKADGNFSAVGLQYGSPQGVGIADWDKPTILHELGHALGFWHEQSRPDRDAYIQINTGNIAPANLYNFDKHTFAGTYGDYDYASIMHYGQYFFSIDPIPPSDFPSITVLDNPDTGEDEHAIWQDVIGTATELSAADIAGMAYLYQAESNPAPANDEMPGAIELLEGQTGTLTSAQLAQATESDSDPTLGCTSSEHFKTVWYLFIPAVTGTYTIDTEGSTYNTVLGVWTGSTQNLAPVAGGCNDDASDVDSYSLVSVPLTAWTFYYIEVAAFDSDDVGDLSLNISSQPVPPNNLFANARVIAPSALPYLDFMSTSTATRSNTDPRFRCGARTKANNSIWYRFRPNFSGRVSISTADSNYDTILAVWTGSASSLTSRGCNDNANGGLTSALTLNVSSGTTYYIEIASVTPGGGLTVLRVEDMLFSDNFENGSLNRWSSRVTDGSDLSVVPFSYLGGQQMMQAKIDNSSPIYVQDNTPNNLKRYEAAFWLDHNFLSMASNNLFTIFQAYDSNNRPVMRIELWKHSNGFYYLCSAMQDDRNRWKSSGFCWRLSDIATHIEVEWRASNNGSLTLYLNGYFYDSVTGIDNSTRRIDHVRLGAVTGIDSGTGGNFYFDQFVSRRYGWLGMSPLAVALDGSYVPEPMEYDGDEDNAPEATPELVAIEPTPIATVPDVPESLVTVEAESDLVTRTGGWTPLENALSSGGAALVSTGTDEALTVEFRGGHAAIAYVSAPVYGEFVVEIDGVERAPVNSSGETPVLSWLALDDLGGGRHTLTIRPVNGVVAIDAFYVVEVLMPEPTDMATTEPTLPVETSLPTEVQQTPEATETPVVTDAPTDVPTEVPTEVVTTEPPPVVPTDAPTTEPPPVEPTDVPTDTPEPVTDVPTEAAEDTEAQQDAAPEQAEATDEG